MEQEFTDEDSLIRHCWLSTSLSLKRFEKGMEVHRKLSTEKKGETRTKDCQRYRLLKSHLLPHLEALGMVKNSVILTEHHDTVTRVVTHALTKWEPVAVNFACTENPFDKENPIDGKRPIHARAFITVVEDSCREHGLRTPVRVGV